MVSAYEPKTVREALLLRRQNPDAALLAGGTDLMVTKRMGEAVIFLRGIQEISHIEKKDHILRIGAGVTYRMLLASEMIPDILKRVVREIASPAIRNVGTLVGNLCNASPAGDTLPVLYLLNAEVIKAKCDGEGKVTYTRMPVEAFITGVRRIALASDEMVVGVEISDAVLQSSPKIVYQKVGARKAEAISKASFIGLYQVEEGIIRDWRVAFGAVGVTVVRSKALEERIVGRSLHELKEQREELLQSYGTQINPIDDQRSTAAYRKKVCMNLLADFVEQTVSCG